MAELFVLASPEKKIKNMIAATLGNDLDIQILGYPGNFCYPSIKI